MRVCGPKPDAADAVAMADFYGRLLGWSIAGPAGSRPASHRPTAGRLDGPVNPGHPRRARSRRT